MAHRKIGLVDPMAALRKSGGMDDGGSTPNRKYPNNPKGRVNEVGLKGSTPEHFSRETLEKSRRYG